MPQFSNDEHWELIADFSRSVVGTPARDNAISPIIFPIPYLSPWFKVFVAIPNLTRNWYYGGRFVLNVGNVENPVPIYITRRKVILSEWKLLEFPQLESASQGSQFHFQYEPPWWFPSVEIEVHQYVEAPVIGPLLADQLSV